MTFLRQIKINQQLLLANADIVYQSVFLPQYRLYSAVYKISHIPYQDGFRLSHLCLMFIFFYDFMINNWKVHSLAHNYVTNGGMRINGLDKGDFLQETDKCIS